MQMRRFLSSGALALAVLIAFWAAPVKQAAGQTYKVFAWNDLGMHCFDSDFSTFCLLPPFNTPRAQVVLRGDKSRLCTSYDVNVSYAGIADPSGSINTTSVGKTNFWKYSGKLFGVTPAVDVGLTGTAMPGSKNTPKLMKYELIKQWSAMGIPITDINNAGKYNTYPMMRFTVTPRGKTTVVSSVDAVIPVSSEMDCKSCHANGQIAASPTHVTFGLQLSTSTSLDMQSRENILRLHDLLYQTNLYANRPVLCASCHYSKALDLSGAGPTGAQIGHHNLSAAMHGRHGRTMSDQLPDSTHPPIIAETGVQACYKCHPGNQTNCLRSVMASAGVGCQQCHGGMLSVAGQYAMLSGKTRSPWSDLPKCQSCHTGDFMNHLPGDVPRIVAFDPADPAATPVEAPNSRFAENAGKLYRDSTGHGGLACAACHGSTHAEWPATNPLANDTITPKQLQGHDGVISECATCHNSNLPNTMAGPHGMHNVNSQSFAANHKDFVEQKGIGSCKACHGLLLEGTYLSKVPVARSFTHDTKTVNIASGTKVSCDLCHTNPLNRYP